MNDVIEKLRKYASELFKLNLKQIAADLDYLCSWFDSIYWINPLKYGRKHLGPDPAGIHTIDPYSHNCPIPYSKNWFRCKDNEKAGYTLDKVYSSLDELESETDDDVELTAISYYKDRVVEVAKDVGYEIDTGGGGEDPDDPDVPDEPIEISGTSLIVVDENGNLLSEHSDSGLLCSLSTVCLKDSDNIKIVQLDTIAVNDNPLLIVPPIISLLLYRSDGTTSIGEKFGDSYSIGSSSDIYYSEEQLNSLGWYTKWRVYTYSSSGNVDICDAPNGTVLTTFGSGVNPIGNPYQIIDGWQEIKFTDDNGATIQIGYFDTATADLSYSEQISSTDVSTITETLEILMGFRFPKGQSTPNSGTIGSSYVSILSEEDRTKVHEFGLDTLDDDYVYGEIVADFNNYTWEALALYSDLEGTQIIPFDMSYITLSNDNSWSTLYITNTNSTSVTAMTWKLRITKKVLPPYIDVLFGMKWTGSD